MTFTGVKNNKLSEDDLVTCGFFEQQQAYLRVKISDIEFVSDTFIYSGDKINLVLKSEKEFKDYLTVSICTFYISTIDNIVD